MPYTITMEVSNGHGHAYIVTYDYACGSIAIDDSNGKECNFLQGYEADDFREEMKKIEAIDDERPDMGFLYNFVSQYDVME